MPIRTAVVDATPEHEGWASRQRRRRLTMQERRLRASELARSGRTNAQIAEELGCTIDTVKSDLKRAEQATNDAMQLNVATLRAKRVAELEIVQRVAWDEFNKDPKPQWLSQITRAAELLIKVEGLAVSTQQHVFLTPPALATWKDEAAQRLALTAAREMDFYEGETIDGEAVVLPLAVALEDAA